MSEEQFNIQLSKMCMALQNGNLAAFADCIRTELLQHLDVIEDMVSPVCNSADQESFSNGSIMIHEGCTELDTTSSGKVYIEFDGDIYSGCRDLCKSVDHMETVPFTIDPSGMLTLTMTYPDEREPDDC